MSRIRTGLQPGDWRDIGPGSPTSPGYRYSGTISGFAPILTYANGPQPTGANELRRRREREERERAAKHD